MTKTFELFFFSSVDAYRYLDDLSDNRPVLLVLQLLRVFFFIIILEKKIFFFFRTMVFLEEQHLLYPLKSLFGTEACGACLRAVVVATHQSRQKAGPWWCSGLMRVTPWELTPGATPPLRPYA